MRRRLPQRLLAVAALAAALASGGCRQVACSDAPQLCPWSQGDFQITLPVRFARSGGTLTVQRSDGPFDPALPHSIHIASQSGSSSAAMDYAVPAAALSGNLLSISIGGADLMGFPAGAAQLTVHEGTLQAYHPLYLYNTVTFTPALTIGTGDLDGIIAPAADYGVALPWLRLGPQRHVYSIERRSTGGADSYRRYAQYTLGNSQLVMDSALILPTLNDVSASSGAQLDVSGDRLLGFSSIGASSFFFSCQGGQCPRTPTTQSALVALTAAPPDPGNAPALFTAAEASGVVRFYQVDTTNHVVDLMTPFTGPPVLMMMQYVPGISLLLIHTDGSASVLAQSGGARDDVQSMNLSQQLLSLAAGAPAALAVGDVDGDGRPDVALVQASARGVLSLAVDQGDGTLAPIAPPMMNIGEPISALAIGDLDEDGRPDLAVGSNVAAAGSGTIGRVRVFLNTTQF